MLSSMHIAAAIKMKYNRAYTIVLAALSHTPHSTCTVWFARKYRQYSRHWN
jgi:hypothetical protein